MGGESGGIVCFCLITAYCFKNVFILANNTFLGHEHATTYTFLILSYQELSMISEEYSHEQLFVGLNF